MIDLSFDSRAVMAQLLGSDARRVGERLARLVIEALDDEDQRQRIVGILRAATVEADTARRIRDRVTTGLLEPIAASLGAGNAPLRADLVMSQIVGVALVRYVVGLEDVASATSEEMVSALAPTLQRYLVGDIS
ncbi:hypothetical protein [Nocardioides sp.]|uniref:TetR/AcrR family transcriptional regulator n=1 Tax=Nocardioides sp. TaxID=35761 RepID=UPI002620200D|nr:hypothetical protein [Nocardioides sp.]MDI6912504.1 hypothetical protein [Nocardioides sp.]